MIFVQICCQQQVVVEAAGTGDDARRVDVKKSIVWGPGLNPNFNVPVRYFYIQAVDQYGNKWVLPIKMSVKLTCIDKAKINKPKKEYWMKCVHTIENWYK